jgi:maleate isomerase
MPAPRTFPQEVDDLLSGLLRAIGASRSTLRLDDPSRNFHINDVVAEALTPGAKSLRGQTSINQRATDTAQWIERHRRLLVQDDLSNAEPRPPEVLVRLYGVKAQMLAPIIREGRLDGWISVHETKAARRWSKSDQAAIARAADQVVALLGRADGAAPSSSQEKD